jgi:hypothetical protein
MKDTNPIRVFISSKQSEFVAEREVMQRIIESSSYMAPVLAEEFAPERSDVRSRYLADVARCPIYVGLFGCIYSEPTEDEYRCALNNSAREILLYVRPCPDRRDERLARLVEEFESRFVPWKLQSIAMLRKKFKEHLDRALQRMIQMLMEQKEAKPEAQGAFESSIARGWDDRRRNLEALGFHPDDAASLDAYISKLREAVRHIAAAPE